MRINNGLNRSWTCENCHHNSSSSLDPRSVVIFGGGVVFVADEQICEIGFPRKKNWRLEQSRAEEAARENVKCAKEEEKDWLKTPSRVKPINFLYIIIWLSSDQWAMLQLDVCSSRDRDIGGQRWPKRGIGRAIKSNIILTFNGFKTYCYRTSTYMTPRPVYACKQSKWHQRICM